MGAGSAAASGRRPDVSRSSQAAAGDAELRDSLAALSRLVQGQGQRGLEDMLRHVAEFAAQAIPAADGAGLTLVEDDRPDTVVATAEFVREVDAIQYGIGEGPCITAAAEQRTVWSGSLGGDRAWPRFGPRAGRLGVHSVLSLPLLGPGGALGAMNLYSHAKHAFDERAIRMGELYAVPAAVTVQNAKDLAQTRRLADQLQAALASRSVIDQAMGIVMGRAGCGPEEAFERLKALSQREHRKLSEVARHLVGQAAARAPARHSGGSARADAPAPR